MTRQFLLLMLLCMLPGWTAQAGQPLPHADDCAALAGLSTGKAVFDIRIGEPKPLLLALKIIEETAAGMRQQQVAPDFILTFRGATLPLLKQAKSSGKAEEQAILAEIHERLAEFRTQRMPLEACSVAARIFKVEAVELDPSLKLIGNSIVSLIGYQQKGYALVPMY